MSNRVQKFRILHDQVRRTQSISSSSLARIHSRFITTNSSRRESIEDDIDEILNFELNNTLANKTRYLWIETSRRNKYKSTSVHENILKIMKSYLLTWLITDQENTDTWIAWSKSKRMWLSDSMHVIWRQLACQMRRRENVKDSNVQDKSMSEETRKMSKFSRVRRWI